jgi:hypothetical protein
VGVGYYQPFRYFRPMFILSFHQLYSYNLKLLIVKTALDKTELGNEILYSHHTSISLVAPVNVSNQIITLLCSWLLYSMIILADHLPWGWPWLSAQLLEPQMSTCWIWRHPRTASYWWVPLVQDDLFMWERIWRYYFSCYQISTTLILTISTLWPRYFVLNLFEFPVRFWYYQ